MQDGIRVRSVGLMLAVCVGGSRAETTVDPAHVTLRGECGVGQCGR
jgi:hypothetical protein